jgi:glycosyltransferase involved in cell wall biosynthesis
MSILPLKTGVPAADRTADVCLIIEGAYPYVAGGVSSWVQDLIKAHPDLTFHLVALVADRTAKALKYTLPDNVCGLSHIYLQEMDKGSKRPRGLGQLFEALRQPLQTLQRGGGLQEIAQVNTLLAPYRGRLGAAALLNSPEAWEVLCRIYDQEIPESSMLDYFWSWRALMGGMFAVMTAPLPRAAIYHSVSTGYAGLLAARAKLETGRPTILTEHGIYTNERRIEIMMADWLFDGIDRGVGLNRNGRDLRDLWIDTFTSYARACYNACDQVITLYGGNQVMQRQLGSPESRMRIIPNGIDYDRYAALPRPSQRRRPRVALIGRVVPIKDIKTYIQACAVLCRDNPEVEALILGPEDEDPGYVAECRQLAADLGLNGNLRFTGRVQLDEYLPEIDVVVLTSISEAQPLTILEAGAIGIPSVVTDVGSCRELIFGRADEDPELGPGGAVTPVASPAETAAALAKLIRDPEWRRRCGEAMQNRVERYYNKRVIDRIYGDLYRDLRQHAPSSLPREVV